MLGIVKRQLLTCAVITTVLASIVIVMEVANFSEPHIAMILGMGLGISTSPLMMEWTKQLRTKRRVDRLLKELVKERQNQNEME